MSDFAASLMLRDPTARPTAAEALSGFEAQVASQPPDVLAQPLAVQIKSPEWWPLQRSDKVSKGTIPPNFSPPVFPLTSELRISEQPVESRV